MRILVTGSSGHLGEALVRTLRKLGHQVVGLDTLDRPFTTHLGSILDRACVKRCMGGVEVVFHAATLHKPHVATHTRQNFIDTNITGTLNMLEAAVEAGVRTLIYTSTTSVFGDALDPPPGAPAVWVTEDLTAVPKNIYGTSKAAAEDLCQLFHRNEGLASLVLRTSRFFPEEDDDPAARQAFADDNLKANEYLFRRVEVSDVVSAHLLAAEHAPRLGFRKFIISATTPFSPADVPQLGKDPAKVVEKLVPGYAAEFRKRGWKLPARIGRVYVNQRARQELGWHPRYDFEYVVRRLQAGQDSRSPLARLVGSKGYHAEEFTEAPCPVPRGP